MTYLERARNLVLRWQASSAMVAFRMMEDRLVQDVQQVLIEACNDELARRRKFEAEASQLYCDLTLARNECIRLRDVHGVLAAHIKSLNMAAPEEVTAAMAAAFPDEVARGGARL